MRGNGRHRSFMSDVVLNIDDPDDWLEPLKHGGRKAERRLVQHFNKRGWLLFRRVPRLTGDRVHRTLRNDAR